MAERRRRNRWVMWIILAVMVVGLAGLGLNSTLSNSQGSAVLKVGQSEISGDQYYSALRSRIDDITRQQGTAMTIEEARLTGVVDQVQSELINRATMSEIARRNNIRATDEAVSRELLNIEAFQDTSGKFNRNNFELFLQNRGITENEFLDDLRSNLERNLVIDVLDQQKLALPAIAGSISHMMGEMRIVEYLTIDKNNLETLPAPAEDEIRARFDQNPNQYMADPVRHYELAYLLPDPNVVSKDAVESYYNDHPDQFGQPAKISYEVLAFPDEASAQAFYENPDFDGVAAERGLSMDDYSYTEQDFSTLPEEAQKLLASGELKTYEPTQSLLGWNVYKVDGFMPAIISPISDVEPQIRAIIAKDNINNLLTPEFDTISDAIASGADPQAVADSSSLEFSAWKSDDPAITGLTDQAEFKTESDSAQIDEERDMVKMENGGVFIMRLTAQDEAKPAEFADVKDQITSEIEAENLKTSLDALAETIKAESEPGELEAASQNNGITLKTSDSVTSQTAFNSLPIPIASELFQQEPGTIWVTGDDERRYIAKIAKVEEFLPDSEDGQVLLGAVEQQLSGSTSEGLIIDYLNSAAQEYGAVKYPALLEQVEAQIR